MAADLPTEHSESGVALTLPTAVRGSPTQAIISGMTKHQGGLIFSAENKAV